MSGDVHYPDLDSCDPVRAPGLTVIDEFSSFVGGDAIPGERPAVRDVSTAPAALRYWLEEPVDG